MEGGWGGSRMQAEKSSLGEDGSEGDNGVITSSTKEEEDKDRDKDGASARRFGCTRAGQGGRGVGQVEDEEAGKVAGPRRGGDIGV